jgi:hypothetical protein
VFQGTVTSSSTPWQSGTSNVAVTGLLSDADLADTTKALTLYMELSFDNELSYQDGPIGNWQGGQPDPRNQGKFIPPGIGVGFSQSQTKPTHCRVKINAPVSTSVGVSAAFS